MSIVASVSGLFKWRQFEPEVILLAIGWYLRFSLSYRDVEALLARISLSGSGQDRQDQNEFRNKSSRAPPRLDFAMKP